MEEAGGEEAVAVEDFGSGVTAANVASGLFEIAERGADAFVEPDTEGYPEAPKGATKEHSELGKHHITGINATAVRPVRFPPPPPVALVRACFSCLDTG